MLVENLAVCAAVLVLLTPVSYTHLVVALTAAFALGNYIGSWLDEKLALGLCAVSIYLPSGKESLSLASYLREKGFGLTLLDGQGIEAVSYTHLDVYKRQCLLSGKAAW